MPAKNPKVMVVVKFKTLLPFEELKARLEQRKDAFRALPGLIQKYYFQEKKTGEIGGVYVWDSHESLETYLASDLRKSIASAYEAEGAPEIEVFEVITVLRDDGY